MMEHHFDGTNTSYRQLSDIQEKILAILPIPSAIPSTFGSVVILIMAFKSRRTMLWSTYHGLLTGMSITNIIFSITLVIGSFLYPQETSHRYLALGNQGTVRYLTM